MARPARLHLLLLSCALTVVPGVLAAQDAKAEVMAVVKRLFDGMRAGDSAMVRSTFHPQLRMLSSSIRDGKPVLRVETSGDGFLRAVGTPHPEVSDERISNAKVEVDGALASVWTDYAFYRGSTFSHCGIDHFLLARNDAGEWKIVELADTRRQAPCPR